MIRTISKFVIALELIQDPKKLSVYRKIKTFFCSDDVKYYESSSDDITYSELITNKQQIDKFEQTYEFLKF